MGAKINNILYGLWTGCVVYKVTQKNLTFTNVGLILR